MANAWRQLVLRREGICDICGKKLDIGVTALWTVTTKKVQCLSHGENSVSTQTPESPKIAEEPVELLRGTPGKSANDKYLELRDKERNQIRKNFGRFKKLAEIAISVREDSQEATNWKTGSKGEEIVGAKLDRLSKENGFEVLHDRRLPGTKANIDHIAITPAGIFVVDAKNYSGQIEVKYPGLFSTHGPQLFIDHRNRTNLVAGVANQVAKVEKSLMIQNKRVSVYGVLTFVVDPLFLFIVPPQMDEILLCTQRGLEKVVLRPGNLSSEEIENVAKFIAVNFPEA